MSLYSRWERQLFIKDTIPPFTHALLILDGDLLQALLPWSSDSCGLLLTPEMWKTLDPPLKISRSNTQLTGRHPSCKLSWYSIEIPFGHHCGLSHWKYGWNRWEIQLDAKRETARYKLSFDIYTKCHVLFPPASPVKWTVGFWVGFKSLLLFLLQDGK